MRDSAAGTVIGKDGLTGVLLDPLPQRITSNDTVRVRLGTGRVIQLPAEVIVVGSDGTFLVPIGYDDIERTSTESVPQESARRGERVVDERVVPVLAEELVIDKKPVQTGEVRVNRRLLEHDETIEMPLLKEHLDVRRVLVDREVAGPLPVRREGETTIIPIVEEVLVVEKRFRLKEEIYVSRSVREELHRERITLHRQEAEIEKFDEQGRTPPVHQREPLTEREHWPRRRKSILGDD